MVAAISQKVKQVGAGGYHPRSGNSNLVDPNGAGATKYNQHIGRTELADVAAAITHDLNIATDSLTLLHQIKKQLLHPEKHHHHVQGDLLKIHSNMI